ncbi:hypothetical protein [Xanthomonas bromi]|uniref:hypothetical protein n=1 Tax=Xanthomonas bromi TaxID=56449 RepID=UPI003CCD045E
MSEKVGAVMQSGATAALPQCDMHAQPMQTSAHRRATTLRCVSSAQRLISSSHGPKNYVRDASQGADVGVMDCRGSQQQGLQDAAV